MIAFSKLISIISILSFASVTTAQTTKGIDRTEATKIIAQLVSYDTSKHPWVPIFRTAAILDQGSEPAHVGEEFTLVVQPGDGLIPSNTLGFFELSKSKSSPETTLKYIVAITKNPDEQPNSIIQREIAGMNDVLALRKLSTDSERVAAFAIKSRELKMPSLEWVLEGGAMAHRRLNGTNLTLGLSDGLSFIATRQDVPSYVRINALTLLDATLETNDPDKELARKIQILKRFLDAFHQWDFELPDGSTYPLILMKEIDVRIRQPWFKSIAILGDPMEQFFKDLETYEGRLRSAKDERTISYAMTLGAQIRKELDEQNH